jgi:hypothetical protein
MKAIFGLILVSMLKISTAPAYSGGVAMQMWTCRMADDATEADV